MHYFIIIWLQNYSFAVKYLLHTYILIVTLVGREIFGGKKCFKNNGTSLSLNKIVHDDLGVIYNWIDSLSFDQL
jgi:hypothetical protein